MSITKNPFLRYQVLDECFSNMSRKYYLADLIKICSERLSDYHGIPMSVSKRTVQYDINFMQGSGGKFAPIESVKDGKSTYYRYSDPTYSFMKKDLDPAELNTLKDALITMSRIKGIPGFDWVNAIQVQLKDALDINFSPKEIISFEGNDYLKGIEYLHALYYYITDEKVIMVEYHPFTSAQSSKIMVSPYYLKEYSNRWFLLGWNHTELYMQTFALDRIYEIETVHKKYIKTDIDFPKYFNEIIGITNYRDKPVRKVVLKISDDLVPYMETKPVHEEQMLLGNILELRVKLNYELESTILSFGEKMTVVEPAELKESISLRIMKMKENTDASGLH